MDTAWNGNKGPPTRRNPGRLDAPRNLPCVDPFQPQAFSIDAPQSVGLLTKCGSAEIMQPCQVVLVEKMSEDS
jgi:hypothetical protein